MTNITRILQLLTRICGGITYSNLLFVHAHMYTMHNINLLIVLILNV